MWRLYQQEQADDVLKSLPANVAKLLDGSEQLLSIIAVAWYAKQTLLSKH